MTDEKSSESRTVDPQKQELPESIAFDYIKSQEFRVIRVHGVVGGVSLWNERQPIPQRVVHSVTEDGKVGDEIESDRVVRDAFVREVEVCAMMNFETALSIADWIYKHVTKYKEFVKEHKSTADKEAEAPDNENKGEESTSKGTE